MSGGDPEERPPVLLLSELLSSAVRTVNNGIRGVAQSPLEQPGKARDRRKNWGSHMSLTSDLTITKCGMHLKVFQRNAYSQISCGQRMQQLCRPDGSACPVEIA